jgi:ankyrin repeat protein
MIAAEKGRLELVEILLNTYKADVKLRDKAGKTALFYAIETNNENLDVVSLLLGNGADPNHEAQDRITPLLKAVEKGHYEITKLLLDRGGNIHTTIESTGIVLICY